MTILSIGRAAGAGPPASAADAPRDARTLYLRDCASCHGADGRGTTRAPSLIGVGRASVDYWVGTGRMPLVFVMSRNPSPPRRHPPAYPAPVRRSLVEYISGLGPGGPDIPAVDLSGASTARGGELFRQQCASCHAWGGDGGALLHREAPALHRATPVQIAEAVRVGPAAMPAFGPAALTDTDVSDLARYVRYLDHPDDRGGLPLWHLGPTAEGGVALLVALTAIIAALRWIGESA